MKERILLMEEYLKAKEEKKLLYEKLEEEKKIFLKKEKKEAIKLTKLKEEEEKEQEKFETQKNKYKKLFLKKLGTKLDNLPLKSKEKLLSKIDKFLLTKLPMVMKAKLVALKEILEK